MTELSRREFAALVAAGVIAGRAAGPRAEGRARAITAGEVIERIKAGIGAPWQAETIDGLKAGSATTTVTGITTTAMATLAVLREAVESGANFIITTEPTFYGRADSPTRPAGRRGGPGGGRGAAGNALPAPPQPPPRDAVWEAKNDFVTSHDLVVFRLNEHWRQRTPDPFVSGLAEGLALQPAASGGGAAHYQVPDLTLEAFVAAVKDRLHSRGGIRVVGDPQARVRSAALLPGSTPITATIDAMPGVDVVLAGEVREWESVEYARDVAFSGQRKGLVLVGRVVSEDPGMAACARWLGSIVTEVPVRHVAAGDPYWRPTA